MLKECNIIKLREAALFRFSLCTEAVKTKMAGLNECFTKQQHVPRYKSQFMKIFDPNSYIPYISS